MLEIKFDGRVAVILGGAGGIGKGIVKVFAQCGASLAVVDINLPEAQKVAEQSAEKYGVKAKAYKLDMADEDQVNSVFKQIHDDFSSLDIVIIASGVGSAQSGEKANFYDSPSTASQRIVQVNILGTGYCLKAALNYMIPQNYGRIVTLASIAGRRASANGAGANYASSKAAIISMTQSVARAHAKQGITCNCICPGYIYTEMLGSRFSAIAKRMGVTAEEVWQSFALDKIPQGVDQTPEDIGFAAAFLVSDRARHITGQTLNVDGGAVLN
ncbi:MAG: SDR family NAD(P)-dependent oxidoreductase [Syntrophomonadaceae bacterium]|jgi:3-oxoacyl-[acyl-carrier protein] reductase